MKIVYFDAFSGMSGDMTVAALAAAGAPETELIDGLRSLSTGAGFRFERVRRGGIAAMRFHVEGGESKAHRHLPQILAMIDRSSLPGRARANAARVFERLGEAEAAIHGVPVAKVHFHEVGAVDSIADIAGACLALELLGVEAVWCSPLNVGSGTVKTEHGILPVPAPATAALLAGKPVYSSGPQAELTTPTGAALASTLAAGFGPMPAMRLIAAGYGAGSAEFAGQANVLRVSLGETADVSEALRISVIEANIDDSTPQTLGYAMERLLEAGALDVTLSPLLMKKNRPGTLLSVLARREDCDTLAALVMKETSSLGVRIHEADRRVQAREFVEVEIPQGRVRVKVGGTGGFAPEYDDCRKLARETGTPLKQILAEASYAYLKSCR